MGLGAGILLIAAGAILAFGVHVAPGAVDVHTIGIILLIVGAIGTLLSMIFWSSWAGPGYWRRRGGPPVGYGDGPYAGGPPADY